MIDLGPNEAIRRIRTSSDLGQVSCNTRKALKSLADEYEALKNRFKQAEIALNGYLDIHRILKSLPALDMKSYVESDVQALNDGVRNVCVEMEVTRAGYIKACG